MKIIIVATCYSTLQKAKRDPSTRSAILIGSHKTLTQDDTAKMKDDKTRWRAEARRYTATNEQCPFPERADTLARVGSPPPFFFAVSSRSKRLSARRGISLRVPISPRMICKCSRHASSCLALCRTPRCLERAQTLLPRHESFNQRKHRGEMNAQACEYCSAEGKTGSADSRNGSGEHHADGGRGTGAARRIAAGGIAHADGNDSPGQAHRESRVPKIKEFVKLAELKDLVFRRLGHLPRQRVTRRRPRRACSTRKTSPRPRNS